MEVTFTMTFVWTDDLATGNPLIDSEHKELIRIIGQLLEACRSGKGREEMLRTIRFLEEYTIKHFTDEEALQRKSNYPDLTNHLNYHKQFRTTVQNLSRRIQAEGASVQLLAEINMNVATWFTSHIRMQDTKVAAHLRSQGIS